MMNSNSKSFVVVSSVAVVTAASILLYYMTTHNKVEHQQQQEQEKQHDSKGKQKEQTTTSKSYQDNEVVPVREIGGMNTQIDQGDEINSNRKQLQRILTPSCITIVHGSMTGTCSKLSQQLYDTLLQEKTTTKNNRIVQYGTIEDFDWWDELLNDDNDNDDDTMNNNTRSHPNQRNHIKPILLLFLPTYTNGTWPPSATSLENVLQDLQHDFRIEKKPLKNKLEFTIFGMGSSEYYDDSTGKYNMGKPAKDAARSLQGLGAKCISTVQIGDDAVGDHAQQTFETWKHDVLRKLNQPNRITTTTTTTIKSQKQATTTSTTKTECCGKHTEHKDDTSCCQKKLPTLDENSQAQNYNDENVADEYSDSDDDEDDDDDSDDDQGEPDVIDVEDMGNAMAPSKTNASEPKEMVTPSQAKSLQKEGYKLIGTHSAVKMCRWTKHQLRGRGGCYKHTFYGITSYQCMEATPSLACANKCVFCWRHHKNPVGKEWRWKTDDPHFIVDEAVKKHIQMIKEAKGIPGVQLDRWKEAHTVRHCALSLVGEPIMYPRIDEFLEDLHERKISTFLVTNGQHPKAIGSIRPVTQLYVSVDAPTQESLIAIDRPLFSDAWDRLKESLSSLRDKGQRTVARLTVVKGWNSDEVEGYAQLIALGKVSLVEVKGVTFCGKSDASNLNMSNSPWHHEVVELTRTLKNEIDKMREKGGDNIPPEYGLACEHKHSCSVLLARVDQFCEIDPVTGEQKWKTWIDYDKFHELAERHAKDPSCTFQVEDYTAYTPSWALFGANEEGFDPTDRRHRKKTKYPLYTKFDEYGVPTHDSNQQEIQIEEKIRLSTMMKKRIKELGGGSVITEVKGGEIEINDPRLMFRSMVTTI